MTARRIGTAAALLVGAALVGTACSSGDAVAEDHAAELRAVTTAYYDALAGRDLSAVIDTVCATETGNMDESVLLDEAEAVRNEVIEVDDVRVEGDTALATVVLTRADLPDQRRAYTMQYRFENGWKLC